MSRLFCFLMIVSTALTASAQQTQTRPATSPSAVRVMSFNIRYGTARDGENQWNNRQNLLIETIKAYNPDLLGMQEVLASQAEFLQKQLPEYGFAGTGRDDGKLAGEFSPVMFRKDRYELLASGQYWLSPTPEVVGSKGWDAALPRIMTWVKLRDRAAGTDLMYFNTHWDHMGNVARVESGKLMRRLIEQKRDGLPVIVTGDFNSSEETPQYRSLTAGDGNGVKLTDAYREAHPERKPDEASFHSFRGGRQGMRIDWILHSPEWKTLGAAINYTQKDGKYPSDHYPVTAEMELVKR